MLHIEPKDVPVKQVFGYLLGGVGPRPIALASTVSPDGIVNLSPFSFFNAFGANPPMIGFSPSRRVRDNTTKDTYANLLATRECVVQAVTYEMVQQVSLSSTEYPPEINEFIKSGLTELKSDLVTPPRVKESPFQMECRLSQMIEFGGQAGSGNLALCEVVKFHIDEELFENGVIHPDRIDLVARMGADFYCRASGDAVFVVKKPIERTGIGYDLLPDFIRNSKILSANNLGQLGNCELIPSIDEIREKLSEIETDNIDTTGFDKLEQLGDHSGMFKVAITLANNNSKPDMQFFERTAKIALDHGDDTDFAWTALIYGNMISEKDQQ